MCLTGKIFLQTHVTHRHISISISIYIYIFIYILRNKPTKKAGGGVGGGVCFSCFGYWCIFTRFRVFPKIEQEKEIKLNCLYLLCVASTAVAYNKSDSGKFALRVFCV